MNNIQNNLRNLYRDQIEKSQETTLENSVESLFEKGKRAEIGEVRIWGGKKFVRHQDGWVEEMKDGTHRLHYGKGSSESRVAEEHHISHHKEHTSKVDEAENSSIERERFSSESQSSPQKEVENKRESSKDPYSDLTPEQRDKVQEKKPSSEEELKRATTVITFANQKLLNLWENEISGQISDGQWENSRNTSWLWKNAAVKLGPETKVEVSDKWDGKKTSFPLGSELKSIVGERATEKAGYKDIKSMSEGWTEINNAIKNHKYSEELSTHNSSAREEDKIKKEKATKNLLKDLKELGFDNQYNFASHLKLDTPNNDMIEIDPSKVGNRLSFEVKNYKGGVSLKFQTGRDKAEISQKIEKLTEFLKNF